MARPRKLQSLFTLQSVACEAETGRSTARRGRSEIRTYRSNARAVGGLFIVGTVAGILSVVFGQSIVDADDYLTQISLNEDRVATGALFELIMGVALVGVAVAVHPVLRRYSEPMAMAYVVARTIEATIYLTGALILLTLLSVSREFVNASALDAAQLQIIGDLLLAAREWAGAAIQTGTVFGLSVFVLNYVLYRGRFVPRWLSVWGLLGGVPYVAAGVMVMYGLDPWATVQNIAVIPLAIQELVFGIWMLAKGFNSEAFESEQEPALA